MPRSARTTNTSAQATSAQPETHRMGEQRLDPEQVARLAYQRFEARGREDGHDLDDWLEAEQELQGVSGEATADVGRERSSGEAA